MYRQEIVDAIIQFTTNEKENKKISYSDLYEKICVRLSRKISHRDYASHLKNMLEENILVKLDEGKRGSSVYYSLSEKGMKDYGLNILGTGDEFHKRLSLYQLLIYFEVLKRGQMLNDKQLNRYLVKIGSSRGSWIEIDTPFKDHSLLQVAATFMDPLKDIQIIQYNQKRFGKIMYYVVKVGFSSNEFISYLKTLKNQTEPRPFSQYPTLIPFARFMEYSKEEVESSMDLLLNAGLIEPITSAVDKNERRFRVADKSLVKVIEEWRFIEIIHYHRIIAKIGFFAKPDEYDRDFLTRYMGERRANIFVALCSGRRRDFLKNCTKVQKKEVENLMNYLNWILGQMISTFKKNEKVLRDEFLMGLVLPFIVR